MSVLGCFAISNIIDEAQALSPKRFQGLKPRKSVHSKDLGCSENTNKAKESEYTEYAEVRDNHEYVSPASSDKGLEIGFPAVLDHQVGNEDTKQPRLNARWNQIGLGNACKEPPQCLMTQQNAFLSSAACSRSAVLWPLDAVNCFSLTDKRCHWGRKGCNCFL